MQKVSAEDDKEKLSCCVVYTPIPVMSWIIPFVGHVGVTDSKGVPHDFIGDYEVGVGKLKYGDPKQIWKVDIDPKQWDEAIETVTKEFSEKKLNFFTASCHHYVASILNEVNVPVSKPFCGSWLNVSNYKLIWAFALHGRSLSCCDFTEIWGPPFILYATIVAIVLLAVYL